MGQDGAEPLTNAEGTLPTTPARKMCAPSALRLLGLDCFSWS
jgi:hypothetical protein